MRNIAVFCGSSVGTKEIYRDVSVRFAESLCRQGIGMVYGAGNIGLMGVIADEMLGCGGRVIGVIPKVLLEREVCHQGLTELHIVDSMSIRKELIINLSDAFVALPGGFGTLDEISEVLCCYQLGITNNPCAVLNINGYWDSLIQLFDRMYDEKFISREHRANIIIESDPDILIDKLLNFKSLSINRNWISDLKEKNNYG